MNTLKQITLENLADSTAREVFDWIKYCLSVQNEKSEKNGACFYRLRKNEKVLRCAGGHLMTDEQYEKLLVEEKKEGLSEFVKLSLFEEECRGFDWNCLVSINEITEKHKYLIMEMQRIHDNYDVEEWDREFKNVKVE